MGRIIAAIGLVGWAGITWLGWRLADARIAVCQMTDTYTAEANCTVRAQAARDGILTVGLAVGLLILLATLATIAIIKARQGQPPVEPTKSWKPTSSGQQARLR